MVPVREVVHRDDTPFWLGPIDSGKQDPVTTVSSHSTRAERLICDVGRIGKVQ